MRLIDLAAAFGTGGLLTLMVLFNGEMAAHSTALFSSLAAHGTGTIAAALALLVMSRRGVAAGHALPRAPLWAYLGGVSGAVTVMLTSTAVNGALALSGTLALGLAGQMVFGLLADRLGLFGLPRRRATPRDMAALGLIGAGSVLIIFAGGAT
ncbi:MAG: EamA-like transporter family protein [Rhodobacterales bacterium]|nr:EamA-like transporter family protein [Rhodobacterales bacterium]